MNEVICLAEDKNLNIYYQDTDSIHITDKHIKILEEEFKKEYGRELNGEKLGQFNSDFESHKIKNEIKSKKLIILGKKCYMDKLVGLKDGKETGEIDYHIRMKGIPNKVIHYTAEKRNQRIEDLYEDLFNGEEITFDLTMDGANFCPVFEKNFTIRNNKMFKRKLKF